MSHSAAKTNLQEVSHNGQFLRPEQIDHPPPHGISGEVRAENALEGRAVRRILVAAARIQIGVTM